jgi:hypothetical protein
MWYAGDKKCNRFFPKVDWVHQVCIQYVDAAANRCRQQYLRTGIPTEDWPTSGQRGSGARHYGGVWGGLTSRATVSEYGNAGIL